MYIYIYIYICMHVCIYIYMRFIHAYMETIQITMLTCWSSGSDTEQVSDLLLGWGAGAFRQ